MTFNDDFIQEDHIKVDFNFVYLDLNNLHNLL